MKRVIGTAPVFIALLLATHAFAQTQGPVLSLEGKVKQPMRLTMNALRMQPPERAEVSYRDSSGTVRASFAGVTLWSLIGRAGGIADAGHGAEVRHPIRIKAKDGYVVVTSTGEIAPNAGGKHALVAYERDGKPLDNFWLVMPGDIGDARYVHDVVSVTVE